MSPQFATFLDDSAWKPKEEPKVYPLTEARKIVKHADTRDYHDERSRANDVRSNRGRVNDCNLDRGKRIAIYAKARGLRRYFNVVVDHIIPLAKGGKHSSENLQIIYGYENTRKCASLDYKPQVVFA